MMEIEAAGLIGGPLDFEPARGRVGLGGRCPGLRGGEPAPGQTKRIPAQPQAMTQRQCGREHEGGGQGPARRGQNAKYVGRPHGNTLRSNSK